MKLRVLLACRMQDHLLLKLGHRARLQTFSGFTQRNALIGFTLSMKQEANSHTEAARLFLGLRQKEISTVAFQKNTLR